MLCSIFSRKTVDRPAIGEQQKKLIRHSYRKAVLPSKRRFGVAVFTKIFREEPIVAATFLGEDVVGDEIDEIYLTRNEKSINHILHFMQAFEAVVDNLEDLSKIYDDLFDLGGRHTQIPKFKPAHFRVFSIGIMSNFQAVLGSHFTIKHYDAMKTAVNYLITTMMNGYEYTTRKKNINAI